MFFFAVEGEGRRPQPADNRSLFRGLCPRAAALSSHAHTVALNLRNGAAVLSVTCQFLLEICKRSQKGHLMFCFCFIVCVVTPLGNVKAGGEEANLSVFEV